MPKTLGDLLPATTRLPSVDVRSVVCCVGEDERGSRGVLSSVGLLSFERSNWFKAVVEEKSHHSSAFSAFQQHKVEEGWVPEVTDRIKRLKNPWRKIICITNAQK